MVARVHKQVAPSFKANQGKSTQIDAGVSNRHALFTSAMA
jgi:hypothetical protein